MITCRNIGGDQSFIRLDVDAERRRKIDTASLAVSRQETRRI